MSEWQPIETAPKEPDKHVLLADADHVWMGWWNVDKGETLIAAHPTPYWETFDNSGWYFADGVKGYDWFQPTHWMPLPPPPTQP